VLGGSGFHIGRDVMGKKKVSRKKLKPINDDRDFLPPFIAWLVDHPLLLLSEEALDDDEMPTRRRNALIKEGKAYEEANPCPSQFARNLFGHYRGQGSKLDKLFFNTSRHYSDHIRKKAKKIEEEEDEAIADLEKTMLAALGGGV